LIRVLLGLAPIRGRIDSQYIIIQGVGQCDSAVCSVPGGRMDPFINGLLVKSPDPADPFGRDDTLCSMFAYGNFM
jgi:hypothetical protein